MRERFIFQLQLELLRLLIFLRPLARFREIARAFAYLASLASFDDHDVVNGFIPRNSIRKEKRARGIRR